MATIQRLQVVFYKTDSGKEPVRDWLKELNKDDRKVIGEDIKTVQFGWPLGMPLVRKLEKGLWVFLLCTKQAIRQEKRGRWIHAEYLVIK